MSDPGRFFPSPSHHLNNDGDNQKRILRRGVRRSDNNSVPSDACGCLRTALLQPRGSFNFWCMLLEVTPPFFARERVDEAS